MKAISCAAPHRLEIVEAEPPALRPGWVRVGIRHVGICGTDYHIFEGNFPYFEYPRIIGHELSGVVLDGNGSSLAASTPVAIDPYLNCGSCPACLEGKTNCCETLKVIGVHADGGMADEVVLPAGNLYPADGISHFRLWQDNLLISRMHARLFGGMLLRAPALLWRRWRA